MNFRDKKIIKMCQVMQEMFLRISGDRLIKDKQQQCQIRSIFSYLSTISQSKDKQAQTGRNFRYKKTQFFQHRGIKLLYLLEGTLFFCQGEEKDIKGQQKVINNLSECFRSHWITCNILCNVKFLLSFNVPNLKNL